MRVHLSINVADVGKSVDFYSRVFGAKPQKETQGYAKFDLSHPALNFSMQSSPREHLSQVNHLGIEVDIPEEIPLWQHRLEKAGISAKPAMNTECCYARQDKIWFNDPDDHSWEIFYVYEQLPIPEEEARGQAAKKTCCGPSQSEER